MLYLVETDVAEISHLTPEELTTLVEKSVIPSMEALNKLQSEKKILAGGFAGQRAHAFIVEAASNEAVSELPTQSAFVGCARLDCDSAGELGASHYLP